MTPIHGPRGAEVAGAGGGLSLVYGAQSTETTLSGAHLATATVLNVASVAGFRLGRAHVARDVVTITAIDAANNRLTLAAGLATPKISGTIVGQAPLVGAGDALALPGGPYAELDVRILYDLRNSSGAQTYNGHSNGAYYGAPTPGSWIQTLSNRNYWWAFANLGGALATYSVGMVHGTSSLTNAWTVEFDPATRRLSFLAADSSAAVSLLPRVYSLIVAGRES